MNLRESRVNNFPVDIISVEAIVASDLAGGRLTMDDFVFEMLAITLAFNLVTVAVILLINRTVTELEQLLK